MGFKWLEEYSVGDAELDGQHKGLIEILDQLSLKVEGKDLADSKEVSDKLFGQLALYVMSHFACEEKRMADSGYPIDKLVAHRHAHDNLIRAVQVLQARMAAGEATLKEVLTFLYGDWWHNVQDLRTFVSGEKRCLQTVR